MIFMATKNSRTKNLFPLLFGALRDPGSGIKHPGALTLPNIIRLYERTNQSLKFVINTGGMYQVGRTQWFPVLYVRCILKITGRSGKLYEINV